jgi:hypothetical protein
MSWVMTGVAVGGSLLGGLMGGDDSWKGAAKKAGQNRASVEAAKSRANALLPAKAKANADKALLASFQASKASNAAQSSAAVEAAAAGAAGANVAQTQQAIEASEANAKRILEQKRTEGNLQIRQERDDIYWEAANNIYSVDSSQFTGSGGLGSALMGAAVSGMGAFAGEFTANKRAKAAQGD